MMMSTISLSSTASFSNSIEILSLKPSDSTGSIKAFVDIRIGGLVLHNFKIVQQTGQRAWLAMPSQEYVSRGGTKKYAQIVEMDEPLQREASRIVLAAWEKEVARAN